MDIEQPRKPLENYDEFKFPYPLKIDQLGGKIDAAHEGSNTRCSVGGYAFMLAGEAISYKARWIPTVCTSYTEAEFITEISVGKMAKSLISIIKELGIIQ